VIIYVAVFPSLVAYYCWDRGVARVGAVVPVHFANLTPLFAALLSTLLLGEAPQGYHLVGLVAILRRHSPGQPPLTLWRTRWSQASAPGRVQQRLRQRFFRQMSDIAAVVEDQRRPARRAQ
jgi:hypothetical protein